MSDAGDGGVARLSAELSRLARDAPEEFARRVEALSLRDQAELALRLDARRRLDLLLHAPRPMRLVRTLPDADLYLTVRELGPTDAAPLLALASFDQLQHLIDLEGWRGDRFDGARAGAWVAMLLEAGEPAFRRLLRGADDELLALLLKKWMGLEQIEYEDGAEKHGHGEGEAGTERGFLTPDGYHRCAPSIAEHAAAIRRILEIFFREHPERYQRVVWESIWDLPSELEERALHWRQARLEEHGFPPFEEALDVYAPPRGSPVRLDPPAPRDPDALGASRLVLAPSAGTALAPVVDGLPAPIRERVLFELAALANHLLVADAGDTGDPEAHRAAVAKAKGFLAVALAARGATTPERAVQAVEGTPILELFREGHARAAELRRRATALRAGGWAGGDPAALERIDAPLYDRILGLLHPRPLFVDLGETDGEADAPRLREFRSLEEIEETRAALEMVETVGDVLLRRLPALGGAGCTEGREPDEPPPKLGTLWLTLLGWHAARDALRYDPLEPEVAADFLRNVVSRRTAPPEAAERATERLVERLGAALGLDPREISVLRAFGRFCDERLRLECAGIDPGSPPSRGRPGCLRILPVEG